MSQITLPGSIFLALIAVFPAFIVKLMGVQVKDGHCFLEEPHY